MILITGGSGFLGEALIQRLYPKKIRIVSRNEGQLIKIKQKFPKIEIITGDIADEWVAKLAMKECDEVYHLAAYKHVRMAEDNAYQCISSNVIGSLNILLESLNTKPKFVVGISTDKAAQVRGVYGATKLLMEALFKEAEKQNQDTKYRIVRYGNVLYSTGSVLCKWKDAIQNGKPVEITDYDSTRFYWTRDEAVQHIFDCLKKAKDATPYVPSMKAMKLGDLLMVMIEKYGKSTQEIIQKELSNNDNKHETIDGVTFSNQVPQYTIKQIMKLI